MAAFFSTYGFLITSMVFAATLALSLYLPLMSGQLSLASPGFYALGGYIAAIMSTKYFPPADGQLPITQLLAEMAIAGLASGLLAVLVRIPAPRQRRTYPAPASVAILVGLPVPSL